MPFLQISVQRTKKEVNFILPSLVSKRTPPSVQPDISISIPKCSGKFQTHSPHWNRGNSAPAPAGELQISSLPAKPQWLFSAPLKSNEDASVNILGCWGRWIVKAAFLVHPLHVGWHLPWIPKAHVGSVACSSQIILVLLSKTCIPLSYQWS